MIGDEEDSSAEMEVQPRVTNQSVWDNFLTTLEEDEIISENNRNDEPIETIVIPSTPPKISSNHISASNNSHANSNATNYMAKSTIIIPPTPPAKMNNPTKNHNRDNSYDGWLIDDSSKKKLSIADQSDDDTSASDNSSFSWFTAKEKVCYE